MKYNQDYLNAFILERIEENLHLDFKASGALDKSNLNKTKDNISKDISAFANADGGIVVYGLKEDKDNKHVVNQIDPIDRNYVSKEWLEQIIQTSIQPKVEGVQIHPIEIDGDKEKVVYVVEVPKSNTAHQSNDQRYYKRHNFNNLPMYDYEIKDIINRSRYPVINIMFIVRSKSTSGRPLYFLEVTARNDGPILAKYIMCHVMFPNRCISSHYDEYDKTLKHYNLDNTRRDVVDIEFLPNQGHVKKYGPSMYVPILPLTVMVIGEDIELNDNYFDAINEIEWVVYADNAQPNFGKLSMVDIRIVTN